MNCNTDDASDDWWKGSVIYEIYCRSFFYTNDDGIGDLQGVICKLDYIAPSSGDLNDFSQLLAKAHALGLKIIIDLVLSHTSDQHPWFQESASSTDNLKSDWYVWADRIAVLKDGVIQQLGTPYEIYNDPVNHFVADFMGSPGMNFIECVVFNDKLIIESGSKNYQLAVPCAKAVTDSGLDTVLLGIRPEMLTDPKPHDNSAFVQEVCFDVEVVEPMGADTVAIGKWNDNEVQVRLSPESGEVAGKGFTLQVDTSKAIIFDPRTGQRIH